MNYIYALYCNDQVIDQTALSEEDEEYAHYLFIHEFGWGKKLPLEQLDVTSVVFLGAEPEPDDYKYSSEVHPSSRKMCSASSSNSKDLEDLRACQDFALPDDHQEDDQNIYCKHCWAVGSLSVCDKYPSEEE